MLTFAIKPGEAILLGEDRVFKTEQDLFDYLVYFVKNTEFPQTVAEYKVRYKEDIGGSLRILSFHQFNKDDVPVNIPNKQHIHIAQSYERG